MTEISYNESDVSDIKEDTECSVENSENNIIVLSSQITKIENTENEKVDQIKIGTSSNKELGEIEKPKDQFETDFSVVPELDTKEIIETTSHNENEEIQEKSSTDSNHKSTVSETSDSNDVAEERECVDNADPETEIQESCKSSAEVIQMDIPSAPETSNINEISEETSVITDDVIESVDPEPETENQEFLESIESNDKNLDMEKEIPQNESVAEENPGSTIPEESSELETEAITALPQNEENSYKTEPPPFFTLEIKTVVSLKENSMIFDELGLGELTHDDLTRDSDSAQDEIEAFENQEKVGDANIENENEVSVEGNDNEIEKQSDFEENDISDNTAVPSIKQEPADETIAVKIKKEIVEDSNEKTVKIENFVKKIKTESEIKTEPGHDPEDLLVELDTTVRRKGRPRKSKKFYEIIETPLETPIENVNGDQEIDPNVPRRRGRKRKPEIPVDTSVIENPNQEDIAEIKQETNDSASIPLKRKLGRPRKSEMDAKRICMDAEVNIAERIMLRERRSNRSINSFDESSQESDFSFNYKTKPSKRGRSLKFQRSRGRPRKNLEVYINNSIPTAPSLFPKRGRPRKCENIGRSYPATATSSQVSKEVVEIEDSDEEISNLNQQPSDSLNDPDNLLVEIEVQPTKRGRKSKNSTPKQNNSYFTTNSYTSNDDTYCDNDNGELDDYEDDDNDNSNDDQDDNPQLVYSYKTNSFVPISEVSQSQSKRNRIRRKARNAKYLMRKEPILPQCEHQKDSLFRCAEVSDLNARYFADLYYKNKDRDSQNAFLLKYVKHCYKRRNCPFYNDSDKYIPIEYHVKLKTQDVVKVCQRTFLDLLQVSRCRIVQILRANNETLALEAKVSATTPPPLVPISRRGGDRRGPGYDKKRESVINYINQFKDQNDYSEKPKVYLSCTIKDLCSVYNSQTDPVNQVLYGYFRGLITSFFEVVYVNPSNEVGFNSNEVIDLADDDDDEEDYNGYNDYSYNDQVQNEYEQQMEDDVEEDVECYGVTYQPKLQIGISNLPESILGD